MSLHLKFRYRFEAAHRFLSSQAPACRTPHGHTWYATAIFQLSSESSLDQGAMSAEFGILKQKWKAFITGNADHSYLHHYEDPIVPSLILDNPDARLLPFPTDPTTEMIAGLFMLKITAMHNAENHPALRKIKLRGVHIQETPTNSITVTLQKSGAPPNWLVDKIGDSTGWWTSPSPADRSFSR
jgi:6-pyruvoyl-tetrahydropterin synthase